MSDSQNNNNTNAVVASPASSSSSPSTAVVAAKSPPVNNRFITRRRRMEVGMDLFSGLTVAGFGGIVWWKGIGGRRSLFLASHMLCSLLFFIVADERNTRQQNTHLTRPSVHAAETGAGVLWCTSAYRQLMYNQYNVWFTGHNSTTATFITLYFAARWGYSHWYGKYDIAPGQAMPGQPVEK